jgi:hypothetical protein
MNIREKIQKELQLDSLKRKEMLGDLNIDVKKILGWTLRKCGSE